MTSTPPDEPDEDELLRLLRLERVWVFLGGLGFRVWGLGFRGLGFMEYLEGRGT